MLCAKNVKSLNKKELSQQAKHQGYIQRAAAAQMCSKVAGFKTYDWGS